MKILRKDMQTAIDSVSKFCSRCHVEKDKSKYSKRKLSFDGLRPICKECQKKIDYEYRLNNAEQLKLYEIKRAKRSERIAQRKVITKKYDDSHRSQIAKRERERRKNDISFRLAGLLRARMSRVIKGKQKSGSAVRDLGCSVEELKDYLESKFYSTIVWENQGTEWELDHIVPLMSFDLEDREQFLKAAHYTNLQPLIIEDHKIKTASELKRGK